MIFKHKILLFFTLIFIHPAYSEVLDGINEHLETIHAYLPYSNKSDWQVKQINEGLTNKNYMLATGLGSYFVRVANQEHSTLGLAIEREFTCTQAAASIGIAPEVCLFLPAQKVLMTKFIPPTSKKLDPRGDELIVKVAHQLKLLHQSSIEFPSTFSPFDCFNSYYEKALKLGVDLPKQLKDKVYPALKNIEALGSKRKNTPCHLDLHIGNIIDDGSKLWIIDWEYSAMADPFFDLACLASADAYTSEQMNQLLTHYMDRPTDEDRKDLHLMRIVADARWASWCFLQSKISKVDFDYIKEGHRYLKACIEGIDGTQL